jgi:hypothetical protein
MRHVDNLTGTKEQEYQEHIEVEAGVKSCSQDIIPPRPHLVAVAVGPEHDNKTTHETTEVARTDVPVECRHGGKVDGRVPETELGLGKVAVQDKEDNRGYGSDEEAIRNDFVDMCLK